MNPLVVNPTTGFLDADNWNSFTSDKKVKFLELADKYVKEQGKWPDLAMLCDTMDIDVRTLDRHLQIDPKFKEAYNGITVRGKWKLESLMYDLSSKSPLYMFGWLRKHFPAEYNPDYKHDVTVNISVSGMVESAKQFIDTTAVDETKSK